MKELIYIFRKNEYYRPYALAGYSIDNIIFYNENGIIFETKQGWLEETRLDKQETNYDILEICVDRPCNKRKVNFSSKCNFYIKHKDYYDTKLDLYIYVDNSFVKVEKTKEQTREVVYVDTDKVTYKDTEFVITGITETPITTVIVEHVKTEPTELGIKARALVEKHKKDSHKIQLDENTWAEILKHYDLVEKEVK